MNLPHRLLPITALSMVLATCARAEWPAPVAPVIPEADGYIAIPHVAKAPSAKRTYRAVYNATLRARDPKQLLPALNMAGSELNAIAVERIPLSHAKFAVVFHGDAIDGILDDAHYREKFDVANPNLNVLSEMRAAGVELYVCGQNLAAIHVDPAGISKDVTVASDALIVLMEYENDGYALLSFQGGPAGPWSRRRPRAGRSPCSPRPR